MTNTRTITISAIFSILFSLSLVALAAFVFKSVGVMEYVLIGIAAADLLALILYLVVSRHFHKKAARVLMEHQQDSNKE